MKSVLSVRRKSNARSAGIKPAIDIKFAPRYLHSSRVIDDGDCELLDKSAQRVWKNAGKTRRQSRFRVQKGSARACADLFKSNERRRGNIANGQLFFKVRVSVYVMYRDRVCCKIDTRSCRFVELENRFSTAPVSRLCRSPIGEVPAMREQITSIIINEITRSLLQRRDSSAKQSDG